MDIHYSHDKLPQYIPVAYAHGIIVVHTEVPSVGRRSMPLHQYLDQLLILYLKAFITSMPNYISMPHSHVRLTIA